MSVEQGVRHYSWGMSFNGTRVRRPWRVSSSWGIRHWEGSEPKGEVIMHRLTDWPGMVPGSQRVMPWRG